MAARALDIKPSRQDVYDFISPDTGVTKNCASGKSVLVTGAGSGIGLHIAIHFARAGASYIVLAGRNAADLEDSKSQVEAASNQVRVIAVPTDITKKEDVANLFDKAGKVDILVNNAGSTGQIAPLASTDFDKWWSAHDINVRGTYLMTHTFLNLLAGGPGVVLNVSSRSSCLGSMTRVLTTKMGRAPAYGASKVGLNR